MKTLLANIFRINLVLLVFFRIFLSMSYAQEKLYTNEFPLSAVQLLDGPFKEAQDLNLKTLLQYDTDRLLEPFLTEAGLPAKGTRFANWDGLAGHVGGHYLTALAIHYASTGQVECKTRMDYMLAELKKCQDANGNGYLGGIPGSKALWSEIKSGIFTRYNTAWVPWYNLHKTYAGLRDAWLYGNSDLAGEMFLKLCNWGIDVISNLTTTQMQQMLDKEFGGMNEVYADAFQMTGDKKYLEAAKKFTHNVLFNAMKAGIDNLDNKHANTQIPKVIGFARIAQLDPSDSDYLKASRFFWNTVVNNRSLALGGNSRNEHFPSAASCEDYTTNREGPESCNTYNMLKLSEDLFKMEPKASYIDFYERAIYNHILSTQHPEHGGYVYFTSARPRHYRVYSAPNQAMWCCVGSGMENHGKYGQMIYTHQGNDSLYVNLFIASRLNWKEKGLTLVQQTRFPDEASTTLSLTTGSPVSCKLLIRHPDWVNASDFKITVNNKIIATVSQPGTYFTLDRTWNNNDQIRIELPMQHHFEEMPNVPKYIALLYGPILLGAKTGNQGLTGLVADDSRWAHIANGELLALNTAPIIEGNRDSILQQFSPVEGQTLSFRAPQLFPDQPNYQSIVFEPFYKIHDSRYMMYWMSISRADYATVKENLTRDEQQALELDRRTVDGIATGEQQPDADHAVKGVNSNTGVHNNEYWRDATNGGYFSYQMATKGNTNLTLFVRYWGNETGNRTFDILVDNVVVATENVTGKWNVNSFVNVEYSIPEALLKGKTIVTVTFKAKPGNIAGGVFYLRLLKPSEPQTSIDKKTQNAPVFYKCNGKVLLKTSPDHTITDLNLFTLTGQLIHQGEISDQEAFVWINDLNKGIYLMQYKLSGKYLFKRLLI